MKYLLIIFFFTFCSFALFAQEKHFVFIQSDNNQPFYVSLNGKLYSSTATGYVIIPKLTDGNYNFSIGFAKNAFPEQSFQCEINNKDLGFNLKNFGEKGWGLFNLQSLSVTMAEEGRTDNISKALSEKDVAKQDLDPIISFDKKKTNSSASPSTAKNSDSAKDSQDVNNDTSKEVKTNDVAEAKGNNNASGDPNASEKPAEKDNVEEKHGVGNDVNKVSEMKEEDGLHMAYSDRNGKDTDTIHVIIPADKSQSNTENKISSTETDNTKSTDVAATEPSALKEAAKDSLKFLDVNMDKSKKDGSEKSSASENNASEIINSQCKNIATDEDYTRLRRKMAMETTDEKMINAARKVYKNKCFTTRQIKSLSTLFLSDEGRYNFFNASYNSVADVSEYPTLQSEFIDPAFIDRFKAMLK
ncbi:DUF4476 domain-containing protein [Segetibacter koreensis]|uniref:DUF4476 domain-containing protein n=1 Tax=Segetibacter koreensis TaxID=398037 RepID=UPI000364C960|nr:DUF4476 domain-containing protein [Segetibacter koreensis]